MLKDKREGSELAFKTFLGSGGTRYLVFKSLDGSFHVFTRSRPSRRRGSAGLPICPTRGRCGIRCGRRKRSAEPKRHQPIASFSMPI